MGQELNKALEAVELTYSQVKEIADSLVYPLFQPANQLIYDIETNINNLSIEALRDYLLRAQLCAYNISEFKDKSGIKAEVAEATKKQAYAISYNGAEGSVANRDAQATLAISENVVAQCLYNLVASMAKTKLDSLHRLIDTLKSILMSRMQEAKFMNIGMSNEIAPTTNGHVVLHS